ncbi:MAG: glycosyltransferase family 4 protein [Planctomycetia bacterium]
MRILTVVFNLEKGGTQRAAQNFAEAYLADGHDSRLLAVQGGGVREKELRERGVPVWTSLDDQSVAAIRGWKPEIVHLHSHGLEAAAVRTVVSGCPDAVVVETNVFSRPSPWVADVDVSFQLSPWCEWLYVARGGPPNRTAVVPNPIRCAGFRRAESAAIAGFRAAHGVGSHEVLLGRIGQAFDRKWSPMLVDAFEHVRRAGIPAKLVVVNAPPWVLARARRSNHANDIVVIDEIIGDEPMSVAYSAIDVFVHVADQGESFGIVLAEAMLCGTPCVTLSTPWEDNSQPGVVGHMQGGLVATSRRGFYAAVERLCRDDELRRELGRRGRLKVLEQYDSTAVARAALRFADTGTTQGLRSTTRADLLASYCEAVDRPSWLTMTSIGRWPRLKLSRYTTGYEPWTALPGRLLAAAGRRAGGAMARGRAPVELR